MSEPYLGLTNVTTSIGLRVPPAYAIQLERAAISLDVSIGRLLRLAVEDFARQHPDIPHAVAEELTAMGKQIRNRAGRRSQRVAASSTLAS